MVTDLILVVIIGFILFKFWSIIIYLNFKIQILQKLLGAQADKEKISKAMDYILENDYDDKTIFLKRNTKTFDTVVGLEIDTESAIKRFKQEFKK